MSVFIIIKLIALMMEAATTTVTSVNLYHSIRLNISEDSHLETRISYANLTKVFSQQGWHCSAHSLHRNIFSVLNVKNIYFVRNPNNFYQKLC